MARPKKNGLDYFSFDTDFFSDKKIKILKARYGTDGIITYVYILCEVYRNGYYIKWDDDYKFIIAEALNLTDGFIEQVLKFLLERSLLDSTLFQSDTIITSPGIQKRYQEAVKTRGFKSEIEVENYWLLNKEETATYIKVTNNESYSKKNPSYSKKNPSYSVEKLNKVKESKVKESKVKEKIECDFESLIFNYTENSELQKTLNDFIAMRKNVKSPMTIYALELMLSKLTKIGKNDEDKITILEESIMNNWKGIFELKDKNGNTSQQSFYDKWKDA